MEPPIEPEHPKAGAVIQGGVLKRPPAGDLDEFHVDLNGLPGLGLLEKLHLPRCPLAGPPQPGQAQISEDPLDRTDGDADVVDAAEPQLGALRPVLELAARVLDELDDPRGYPPAPTPGVSRN